MKAEQQITTYITSQDEPKRSDLQALHSLLLNIKPDLRLWFYDGKNSAGKTVTNPNCGYGFCNLHYANGETKEFYQIGISATKTGISIYILGKKDLSYLVKTFGKSIGKASVTAYCIKLKDLNGIQMDVLKAALLYGLESPDA